MTGANVASPGIISKCTVGHADFLVAWSPLGSKAGIQKRLGGNQGWWLSAANDHALLIPNGLRPALAELEGYLDGEPPDRLSDLVLVLASTWVLGDAGFDLDRYTREAKAFYELTPEHDRVLTSFPESMGFYLSLRLMMDEGGEREPERARTQLDAARAALAARADLVEAEYPLIADGFRRLLEETANGVPPDDRLWHALARRIGDRYLPDWLLRAAP